MAIPKAVEDANRRAEELMQQRAGTPQTATPDNQTQQQTAPAPAPVQQAPAPAPVPDDSQSRPAIMDGPEPKDWEHKYRVLQGKYSHEVPALKDENRKLKGDLQALKEQVDKLTQDVQQRPQASAAQPAGVKPEEVQQYGEDFVDFVRRVATSVVPQAPVQVADTSQLEARVARAENVGEAALRRQFFNDLADRAPNWEQLNTDNKFLTWLDEVDPMTGMTRQAVFDDAYAKLDVNRVAAFFKAYGGNVGAAPNGAPPANVMVTPMTMRGQPDVPQGKRIWTQREIGEFFTNVRTGRITPEDAARVEQDIFAAQSEGRVRQ